MRQVAVELDGPTELVEPDAEAQGCLGALDVVRAMAPGATGQERLYLSAGKALALAFAAPHRLSWEIFEATRRAMLAYQLWRPDAMMGGTQLMQFGSAAPWRGAGGGQSPTLQT